MRRTSAPRVGLPACTASRSAACFAPGARTWRSPAGPRLTPVPAWRPPARSPQDYLFQPGNYADDPAQHGTPLQIREASLLGNPRTPAAVKVGGVAAGCAARPSAGLPLLCAADGTYEAQGAPACRR